MSAADTCEYQAASALMAANGDPKLIARLLKAADAVAGIAEYMGARYTPDLHWLPGLRTLLDTIEATP